MRVTEVIAVIVCTTWEETSGVVTKRHLSGGRPEFAADTASVCHLEVGL